MNEEHEVMVQDIFTWGTIDKVCEGIVQFYNCTLKVKIGKHEIGDNVDMISVIGSRIQVAHNYDKVKREWGLLEEYELSYSVGKIIDKK